VNDLIANRVDSSVITLEYYTRNYKQILPRYIAYGRPTEDTLKTYFTLIDQFIDWCHQQKLDPIMARDYQLRVYIEDLIQSNHSDNGIALRVTSIRAFYGAAVRLGLLTDNPCQFIRVGTPFIYDEQFKYFTVEQIREIYVYTMKETDELKRLRDVSMFLLMASEGLRVVEVYRMNDEDIDFKNRIILVRGKGHNGTIYPSSLTMNTLKDYINWRPASDATFISLSRRNKGMRIQRNGIRKAMDRILEATGYKEKGISCHVLRHSCGTNLYAKTKDLRVVQETLRQRDPKITARYAHVQERVEKRYTDMISP